MPEWASAVREARVKLKGQRKKKEKVEKKEGEDGGEEVTEEEDDDDATKVPVVSVSNAGG